MPGFIVTVLLGALVVWIISKLAAWYKIMLLVDKFDGPKTVPFLGNLIPLLKPPEELLGTVMGYCPPVRPCTRVWLTRLLPYVLVHKASAVETVLSSQKIITKSWDYDFLQPWLGTGLLISTGSKWFGRRKMLTPAFHFKILEDFMDVFNAKSQILVQQLKHKATGEPFDLFDIVTLCALDVIIETAMGLNMNVQENSETDYVRAVQRLSGITQLRQKSPWLHPDWLFNMTQLAKQQRQHLQVLHGVSMSTIRDRRQKYSKEKMEGGSQPQQDVLQGGKKRLPFLDLMLQYCEDSSGNFSDEDIREEVDTFMFEGHDTTATAMNMTLYLLGHHPQIQSRVHEELDAVLGTGDEPITKDQVKELKLLEYCIKESLRLYPSVPIFGRRVTEDFTLDGKTMPAGTSVLVFTHQLHRDPDQFPDPEKFDPDRFQPDTASQRHPYAYVPFSAGPRNCIGQKFALLEEKVVLASVLRKYWLESLEPRRDMKLLSEIILRPKNGVKIKMWPREQPSEFH